MSYDCEKCGGDLTGNGGLPCSCPQEDTAKKKKNGLSFEQRFDLGVLVKEMGGPDKKLPMTQEEAAKIFTEALGFPVSKGHVTTICKSLRVDPQRKVVGSVQKAVKLKELKAEFEEFKEQVGEDLRLLDKDVCDLKKRYGTIFKVLQEAGINVPI